MINTITIAIFYLIMTRNIEIIGNAHFVPYLRFTCIGVRKQDHINCKLVNQYYQQKKRTIRCNCEYYVYYIFMNDKLIIVNS